MSKSPATDITLPVLLEPVYIPKPWGQEIWHTGMEARGESQVHYLGDLLPLSEYLQLDPSATTNNQPLLLLKELDPSALPVIGDLYFEVHEHKQEVYVVTHIDPLAWPNQQGGIRFGMNQSKRALYASDTEFRQHYLDAVQAYEKIRRTLDEKTLGAEQVKEFERLEKISRQVMEEFTHMRNLSLGEVVQVPTWTPHALQHGVRVVEFQTPTYERFILSFAQKVLTQDHWDTTHAVQQMHIEPPQAEAIESLAPGVERIARFSDFNALRINLEETSDFELPRNIPYAVCMALNDGIWVGPLQLKAQQACLIPCAGISAHQIHAPGGQILIAAPGI